ncbi:MAG: hypothetical protein KC800_06275 [Candidatus Eremiobacteraeota bacterium]|nr:hypothetical protein [Candidatus Eremiobacteraeota bacterium]
MTLENLKVPGPLEFGRSQEISLASLGSSESSSLLLEIKVDPGNAVRESSESNNSYVGSVKTGTKFRIPKGVNLKALPDLVVDKPEFKGGHISLRVVNIGKGWTSADFIVDIRTGGHHRNSNRHGRLSVPAPGKSRVVHLSSPHWTVGYDLEVEVDPEGRVRESDETNNVLTLTDLARPSPQELEEARNLPRMMTASEKETSYEVFQRINELRREAGVAPLERVEALDSAAVHHGRVCHFFGKGGHSSPLPGLETATRRARAALPGAQGVNEVYAGHSYTGNVTADFELKGEYFVHLWMESPGHRRAILDPNYQYIGVGVAVKGTAVNATGLLVRTLHGDPTR